jgi:hypothetical protein
VRNDPRRQNNQFSKPEAQILPANHKDLQALNTTAKSFKFLVGIYTNLYLKNLDLFWKVWTLFRKIWPILKLESSLSITWHDSRENGFCFWLWDSHDSQVSLCKSLKGHWGDPNKLQLAMSQVWLMADYSYIKPCCFATALQQGTHYISIKKFHHEVGDHFAFQEVHSRWVPTRCHKYLSLKDGGALNPLGRVLSEPGLGLAPPRMGLLFW